jgi:hypothetical protein
VLLCRRHHRRVHEDGWKVFSDKNGQVVFFTPSGKALAEVSRERQPLRAVEVPPSNEVASAASVAFGAAVSPADAGGLSTAGPTWRHDRDVPWSIEAADWEALDPSGAS